VAGGQEIVAVITKSSVKNLGLAKGKTSLCRYQGRQRDAGGRSINVGKEDIPVERLYFVGCVVFSAVIVVAASRVTAVAQDGAAADKKTIVVFAAASTTSAIDEIKRQFAKQAGIDVQTSYAASASLANQIVNGADAGIFISADTKWADYLAEKHLVAQRRDALGNRLVIVVPNNSKLDIKKTGDLMVKSIEHVAIGDPDSAPAGKYAKQALVRLELWEKLKDKMVPAQDVRQALTFVETGAAESGIVYATDAAISKKVKVAAEIPEKLTGPIRYPILLLAHEKGKPEAELFFRYLNSPEAVEIFKKYGFTIQSQ
jgi:molybdate transport system substrate-binding protein